MNILYICSFALKYYAMVTVSIQKSQLENPSFWSKLANISINDINTQKEIYETFYWLNDGNYTLINKTFKNDFV